MGKSCCAIDCTHRFSKKSELSFYRLLKNKLKRDKWIAAIRRNDWIPDTETWICGSHFVSGNVGFLGS
ncbi:MAG: THAP domain-containing protein [bacterium]|nr:THAP domain-containing protein [bacterium]